MRGVNRLSASCCSLPIAASVVPASSPRAGSTDPNRASPDTCDRTARTTLPLPHLRRARSRADLPVPADCCQPDQSREDPPPLGLSGAPPPVCPRASTPPELAPRFGPRHGGRGSRSVPVVSHHSDGFLRSMGSGPVASRYRTWGSLGFNGAVVCSTPCGVPGLNQGRASDAIRIPTSATPFEGFLLVGSRSPSLGSAPS